MAASADQRAQLGAMLIASRHAPLPESVLEPAPALRRPAVDALSAGRLRAAARLTAAVLAGLLAGGCATRSADVRPVVGNPGRYATWDCEHLFDEMAVVQRQASDVAYEVDSRVGNNLIALGLGATVFWPALLAMRPDGPEATELAELKGRDEAMRSAANSRPCGAIPEMMAARRQAALPVVLGERLVYEQRSTEPGPAPASTVAMTVTALRRDHIEFSVLIGGQPSTYAWHQDLAGNPVLDGRAPLIGWRRLLKTELVLGQVLSGELAAAGQAVAAARVRGQVVALGPQTVDGRAFDVAVIELFGEAPLAGGGPGQGSDGSTRLDGVMAVDRHSGVLLRLDLRCANPDYALRRRLVRVETPSR